MTTPSATPRPIIYAAPLYALADGWKLLAPPRETAALGEEWEWWFVREVDK